MKWTLKEAEPGDMIRMPIGELYHYGIYISDNEIIQFGEPPVSFIRKDEDIEVCVTDVEGFMCGQFLEVAEFDHKEMKKKRTAEQIIATARARIGERGYNLLHNNCEHFANECVFGECKSDQSDAIRKMWRKKLNLTNK